MTDPTPDSVSPRTVLRRGWAAYRGWPGAARLTSYGVVGLVVVLVAGLVTVVTLARRPLPQDEGRATVAGLEGEVEVVRDEHGIPQLYGDSLTDLVRAQGYVHAQERFFEMDVRRHATAGRLAEMFGEDAVESDSYVRTMGWRRVAEQELALVRPDTRAALQAYAEGVNAYLDEHSPSEIAVEYTVLNVGGLDYTPEDWTPVDSLAWLKAMAWDLRGNMQDEIDRVLVRSAVGPERMRALYPSYPFDEHEPIVGQGTVVDGVFEQDASTGGTRNPLRPAWTADQRAALREVGAGLGRMPDLLGEGDGIGSNSWVVSGDRTATGAPLLANDPHLGVGMPGVWTQMGLHCRRVSEDCPLDVAGFTFSGVPGVIIGHNADIAWGFTNLAPDVTDLYLEQVRGDEWRSDGAWRPLRTRIETIEVADGEDVELTVRSTRHGPILSDVADELADVGERAREDREFAVALSWTALEPAPTADAILDLNLATDWDSFRAALSSFAAPSQNVVYADREGHIGYQAPGRVPIRKSGNDGTMPSAGWRPENDWTGEVVPYDGLPNVLDPDEGFVVAANQAVIGDDYPYRLTDDWDHGWRSQRIRDVLSAADRVDVDAMLDLQLDDRHPFAPLLTPYLLDVALPHGYWSGGQDLLRDWDFDQSADSGAAAYYNVVWRTLLARTFHDELPEDQWPDGGQRWYAVVAALLEEPDDPWWDDTTTADVVEDRDTILEQVQREARDELTRRQSRDPAGWTWGHLHRLELRSPTLGESGIGPVERLVNRGGWEVGGGSSTVDASAWDAAEGYEVTSAPSMRMVVSLDDLDASRWINLTGVSGHPASDHYTDQTDLWARGESLPWAFSSAAVEESSAHVLTLVPGSSVE
ncbi:penicillin acylase family protein [Nocardioides lianchengensis]|uniref:Penicillin amidase n=1 Tax=Nocardioides lianchengensis TaxID=1045774 RepID=A0A1G6Z5E6_9ACTN|nr:penicillin acylase family protein [Nocardioides lianchengensis]NYG11510.1 penicillin amidase [Nocardioides lianchengensis]SDD97848.1 penicillin amidase [Nocardioides lianchengensis]